MNKGKFILPYRIKNYAYKIFKTEIKSQHQFTSVLPFAVVFPFSVHFLHLSNVNDGNNAEPFSLLHNRFFSHKTHAFDSESVWKCERKTVYYQCVIPNEFNNTGKHNNDRNDLKNFSIDQKEKKVNIFPLISTYYI